MIPGDKRATRDLRGVESVQQQDTLRSRRVSHALIGLTSERREKLAERIVLADGRKSWCWDRSATAGKLTLKRRLRRPLVGRAAGLGCL